MAGTAQENVTICEYATSKVMQNPILDAKETKNTIIRVILGVALSLLLAKMSKKYHRPRP